MLVVIDLSEDEISRINEAINFTDNIENIDSDEIAEAIHTLIEYCM